jgi:tetratricopeptide (TPR) repeat protein
MAPYDVRYLGDLATSELLLMRDGDQSARGRAVRAAQQALDTDPNNPQASLTSAAVAFATGDVAGAVTSIDRAVALDPASLNARLYLTAAQIYLAGGRPEDALRLATEGLQHINAPGTRADVRVERARALAALDRVPEALAELDLALQVRPNDAAALRLRDELRARSSQ